MARDPTERAAPSHPGRDEQRSAPIANCRRRGRPYPSATGRIPVRDARQYDLSVHRATRRSPARLLGIRFESVSGQRRS
ncbi:MAG: hypothetical protein D6744_10155 [Planctomycetota bacterium]|nr:MAG: hypothetical protein D6744_10155 [Planctomycetota bacterium]